MKMIAAHSVSAGGIYEPLPDHLEEVARLCAKNCQVWDAEEEGRLVGFSHDLGKCGVLFQRVLSGQETKIDHEAAGAYWILKQYGPNVYDAALAIHGHHKGLITHVPQEAIRMLSIDKFTEYRGRRYSCTHTDLEQYLSQEGLTLPALGKPEAKRQGNVPIMLRVRMLLSALADADYSATNAHFRRTGHQYVYDDIPEPRFDEAYNCLCAYRAELMGKSTAKKEINALRRTLFQVCLEAAAQPPGAFTLTAPTGSGKTLAMLAFALKHAWQYGKRRIILVLPYLTLIEQAAEEVRKAFTPLSLEENYIFEDHSLADKPESGFFLPAWDQPVIITSTVKFFESLFAAKPARLRHLHNIADAVVLFDEAQSLPFGYAPATLTALSSLCTHYRASVVFSTATQPALDLLDEEGGWRPREIVPEGLNLFERARRVRVRWPSTLEGISSWEALAETLLSHPSSLTVVNTRAQAKKLVRSLQNLADKRPVYHLSTGMCLTHRSAVLNEIRMRLDHELPCILVSTQCIEAGVDISFPVVYRALAPLESVIQAFGRCNRNGQIAWGDAVVFVPPDTDNQFPDKAYEAAALELKRILKRSGDVDIDDPNAIRAYFQTLIKLRLDELRTDDRHMGKYAEFNKGLRAQSYEMVSENYRWIDDPGFNILVPYKPMIEEYEHLQRQAEEGGLNKAWLRAAQPLSVSLNLPKKAQVMDYLTPIRVCHQGESLETGWYFPLRNDIYDDVLGFLTDFQDSIEDYMP